MHGIQMAIPGYLNQESAHQNAKWMWKGTTSSGTYVYYNIEYLIDPGSVLKLDSYSLNDTPDIMKEYIFDFIDKHIPAGKTKSTISVDTETKKNMLGYEVIRRTGTIHAEKYDESHELSYAAYYGLFDLQNGTYKKVPAVWIAVSEGNDAQVKAELEKIVDLAYDNAKLTK